jgi:hypothetical protein
MIDEKTKRKREIEDEFGESITDVAKRLSTQFGILESSAQTIVHDMLSGKRWFPVYAKWLEENYFIRIEKPEAFKTVKEKRIANRSVRVELTSVAT